MKHKYIYNIYKKRTLCRWKKALGDIWCVFRDDILLLYNVCGRLCLKRFIPPVLLFFLIPSANYLATLTFLSYTVRAESFSFSFLSVFSTGSSFLCLNHFNLLTDRSNVRTVNTMQGSVIGCTENLLLGSLWTYQSSLTYVFKAALLAACSSCHGNPNAISPHCLDCSISRKLFQFRVLVY